LPRHTLALKSGESLRLLLIHADYFEYHVREPAVKKPEQLTDDRKSLELMNTLVVFVTVERDDEGKLESVVRSATHAICDIYEKISPSSIVIYPYAHLSQELASPDKALEVLRKLEEQIAGRGLRVFRAPFGWYKAFSIKCKGHPLAELSRTIKGEESAYEEVVEREESEFIIVEPNGEEHPLELSEVEENSVLAKYPLLKQFIRSEELGIKPHKMPEHIRLMRRLELVDYEPASDVGHFRYYPKGELIKNILEDFATQMAIRDLGAMKIETPFLYRLSEPDIAEQAARFRERDYRLRVGNKEFVLRFAGDFGLFRMMKTTTMTYRQLPIRIYELAKAFRLEQSGELVGLRRLRAFTMPDIHSFCRDLKQGMEEYEALFKYYTRLVNAIGIEYVLAFRVVKDFYVEHKEWIKRMIREVGVPALIELLPKRKHYWVIKHEYQFVDSVGGNAQLCTVQLDVEDSERYGIFYVDEDGKKKGCIIVHSSMGSIERWIYALLEEAAKKLKRGEVPKLPTWLSPIQVRVVPVSKEYLDYAIKVAEELERKGYRVDVDDREETVSAKIRDAETEWIPFIVVVGRKELKTKKLSVRIRGEGVRKMDMEELIERLKDEVKDMPKLPRYTPKLVSLKPRFS